MKYLLDTNTIIDFTNYYFSLSAKRIITSAKPAISFITRIEIFAWPLLSATEENSLMEFVNRSTVYGIEEAIILRTISTRKQYKLKLPDAIIAATALEYNLILLSRNLKDFKNTTNLVAIDPYTL